MPTSPPPTSRTLAMAWRRDASPLAMLAWLLIAWLLMSGAMPARAQSAVPASVLGQPVQQVALGGLHTCALTAAGAVQCWGWNTGGQLGDGTTTDQSTPQTVPALASGVVAVVAGMNHTCALTTAGAVQCWGNNFYGQLGDGSAIDKSTPQTVPSLAGGVVAIAAGAYHTCVLTTAGAVQCWGSNATGQLGDGSTTDQSTPQPVPGLARGVAAIATGDAHTCALTTAGAVLCWGKNLRGQLGDGSTTNRLTPQPVTGLASGVAAITAGELHTCALTTAGAVQCWGNNSYGQLGDGSSTNFKRTPQAVPALASGVAAVAAGANHTCALTTAGAMQCWGFNAEGQLGDGSTTHKSTPQTVPALASGVAAIAPGIDHTCALTTAGAVQCWGHNSRGQLGDGSTTSKTTPQPVAVLASGVAALAPGGEHTCALTTAGAVQCWGRNNFGQLGDGSTTNKSTPQPATGLASGVAAIAAGVNHTCALTTAGAVQCWGRNASGQVGDGSTADKTTPQPVTGLASGVAAMVTGDTHTCALTTAGAVQCWGNNAWGKLGDGSNTNKTTPQPVTGLASGVAAIAGGNHTCALTTAGALQCWGLNSSGQLGDGSLTNKSTPQPVTGLASGVAAIAAGTSHTCALSTAGAVQCWGNNAWGQLGDGSLTNKSTPQPVTDLASGVAAIAAEGNHTCALTTAGAVHCWGRNDEGQLGDGSLTSNSTPQPVTGLASGVEVIAVGAEHTCALTTAGAVQCWGYNGIGQLGNGTNVTRNVPTKMAAAQAIDMPAPFVAHDAGTSGTLAATASSGLAVAFDTFTPDVCTVTGTTLTVLPGKSGYLCGVLASQAGGAGADAAYFAAAPTRSRLLLVPDVPDAPTAVTASAGDGQALVTWVAPASNGGSAITAYTVTAVANPAKTCTVSTGSPLPTTCAVMGLANGTAYTFAVKATNGLGDSVASAASVAVTPTESFSGPSAPTPVQINQSGSTTTVTDPGLPIVVGPDATGATIVMPGTGTTPVTLQITVNGQPLSVQALPGTQLKTTQVNGQTVLVLVVLQGWASMTSSAPGQPMALAGEVLLSAGIAGTRIEAQPLAVAVVVGSLLAPPGGLPQAGSQGLLAGERLLVDAQGKLVSIALGSLKGDARQVGDAMAFANLPASITVDGAAYARLSGAVTRLQGAGLAQGLETAPSGVVLVRDVGQTIQLLPVQPITIDMRLTDGATFTPLGLLRWVRGGVVVQFAPAVADLAGLANAITAVLPDALITLGAEGVLQLRTGGHTYVLRPDWTGGGPTATGTPQIGVDEQGRIYLQAGQGARQLLLPALLSPSLADTILSTALPGAVLALQQGASDGAMTLTLAGTQWRLVPQWVLPEGGAAQQTAPWALGADGVLYLRLGARVQGVRIAD